MNYQLKLDCDSVTIALEERDPPITEYNITKPAFLGGGSYQSDYIDFWQRSTVRHSLLK